MDIPKLILLLRYSDTAINTTKQSSLIVEKRVLRSHNAEKPTNDVNSTAPEGSYEPGKRQYRLKTVSIAKHSQMLQKSVNDENAAASQASYVPGKRQRRVESMPTKQRSNAPKRRRNSLDIDSSGQKGKKDGKNCGLDDMKDIIKLNCKLTNELLGMKKLLTGKNDEFNEMQKQYYEKDIACLKLNTLVSEQAKQIDELKKSVQALMDEKYCNDLIQFDDIDGNKGKLIFCSSIPSNKACTCEPYYYL